MDNKTKRNRGRRGATGVGTTTARGIDSAFTPQVDAEVARMLEGGQSRDVVWDSRLESDAVTGKLDDLLGEARRDHRAGRTKPL